MAATVTRPFLTLPAAREPAAQLVFFPKKSLHRAAWGDTRPRPAAAGASPPANTSRTSGPACEEVWR
jgi:hypothetical protein